MLGEDFKPPEPDATWAGTRSRSRRSSARMEARYGSIMEAADRSRAQQTPDRSNGRSARFAGQTRQSAVDDDRPEALSEYGGQTPSRVRIPPSPYGPVLSEVEHQQQSVLDCPQLVPGEVSNAPAERPGVNCADHLAENLRWLSGDRDLRVKARWKRRARCRAHDDGRKSEQIVGLDDHRVAAPLLNVAALAGQLDRVDITTDHAVAPSGRRPRVLLERSSRSA